MPTTANSPSTEARNALTSIIQAEFTDQTGLAIKEGRLDGAVGMNGAVVSLYVTRERPKPGDLRVLITEVKVQFFGRWSSDGDPLQPSDPSPIEALADRLRRAVGAWHNPAPDNNVWYFTVTAVDYPTDPTGRLTRFVMTLDAYGDNPAP